MKELSSKHTTVNNNHIFICNFHWVISMYLNKFDSPFSQSKDNHLGDFCDNEAMGTTSSTKHWNACQRGKKNIQLYIFVFLFLTVVDKNTYNWIFQCYSSVCSLKLYSGSAVIISLQVINWIAVTCILFFATGKKFSNIGLAGLERAYSQSRCSFWWQFCNVAVQCFSVDQLTVCWEKLGTFNTNFLSRCKICFSFLPYYM